MDAGPEALRRSGSLCTLAPMTRWNDWVHVMFSAYGHWLPGDPRGFRNHDHRIHSSGDYKHPPPITEHAGLRRYAREITGKPVSFPTDIRPVLAEALASKWLAMRVPARIVGVGSRHAHALIRVGPEDAKPIAGRAKQAASHRVRDRLPGTIWGQGCHPVRVRDQDHYRAVVEYIEDHRGEGAALWVHPKFRSG